MTDDAKLNQTTIILAQLTRDMPNTSTDVEIKRKVELAMRIQGFMEATYNGEYTTVLTEVKQQISSNPELVRPKL